MLTAGWHMNGLDMHRQAILRPRTTDLQMQGFMQKVKEINEANKMSVVKVEAPKARPVKLPPDMLEVTQGFKKEYPRKDLELLWGALLKCYGTADLAKEAVYSNKQILNPSYSFCNTMLASKEVLFGMMGEDEALEVMMNNPAVLQCGPSLDTLGPDEIKAFAYIRSVGNKIPESARSLLIGLLIAFCGFPIVAQNVPALQDSLILNLAKPAIGVLFAVLIEGSRIAIVGTIVKAKISGDERIKKAEEATARRMGKQVGNSARRFTASK